MGGNLTLIIAAASILSGNAAGVSWENIAGESFVVEYSNNGFANSLQIETQTNALDTFNMPSGTYQWHVKAEDGEFVNGETIVSDNNSAPQEFVSDGDGNMDLFFGKSAGTWNKGFGARHLGYSGPDFLVEKATALSAQKLCLGGRQSFFDKKTVLVLKSYVIALA